MKVQIPSIVASWIMAVLVILIGVLGLVMTFFQKGDFTIPSIIGLVIGCLLIILNWLTNNTVNKIVASLTLAQLRLLKLVKRT